MKYKIWYVDTVVDCSDVESFASAPTENVLIVYEIEKIEDGLIYGKIFMGSDWYWITPDGTVGQSSSTNERGVWTELSCPEGSIVKKGIWTTDERMAQALREFQEFINNGS